MTTSSDGETPPIVGIIAIFILLGMAILNFFMDVSSAHRELKISSYDTNIPTWAIALASITIASGVMLSLRRYFIGNLLGFFFFLISSSILISLLFNDIMYYTLDEYLAFNGPSETGPRKIELISSEFAGHKGWLAYKGIINNDGFVARPWITVPLYQLIETSHVHPCVRVIVQKTRANERILFSHNVLDVSDVVQC